MLESIYPEIFSLDT